jgi:SAM-dependent methyltransferase
MNPAEIYPAIYADPAHPTYGSGLERYREILQPIRAETTLWRSVLDLGCGRGDFVRECHRLGVNAVGWDPWVAFPDDELGWRFINTLPAPPIPFDLVTCVDVLEHCLDEGAAMRLIDLAFAHARFRASFAISDMSDIHRVPGHGDVELHTLRRDLPWWLNLIQTCAICTGFATPQAQRINSDRFLIWADADALTCAGVDMMPLAATP